MSPEVAVSNLINELRLGVVVLDETQHVYWVNRSAAATLGWEVDELMGKPLSTVLPASAGARHAHNVKAFLQVRQGPVRPMHGARIVWGLHRSGVEIPVEIDLAVVDVGDRKLPAAFIRDAAARYRAQTHSMLQSRLMALGDAAARPERVLPAVVEFLGAQAGFVVWIDGAGFRRSWTTGELSACDLARSTSGVVLATLMDGVLGGDLGARFPTDPIFGADGFQYGWTLGRRNGRGSLVVGLASRQRLRRAFAWGDLQGTVASTLQAAVFSTLGGGTVDRARPSDTSIAVPGREASLVEVAGVEARRVDVDSVPIGIFQADSDGRWTCANAAWTAMTGLARVDALGSGWLDAIHTDDRRTMLDSWRMAFEAEQPFRHEARVCHPAQSRIRWAVFNAWPLRSTSGMAREWVGSVTDITAEHLLREEVVRAQVRLEESQRVGRLGSWEWSVPAGEVWWSREVFRLLGVDDRSCRPSLECYLMLLPAAERDRVAGAFRQTLRSGDISVVHKLNGSDGELRWLHVRGRVVDYRRGKAHTVVGTIQDITERRALEQRVHDQARLEAVGQLAGGVAHDFNNLLTVVLGTAGLLRERWTRASQEADELDDIIHAAQRAAQLTRQLLAVGQRQLLSTQLVDLNAVVRSFERIVARTAGEHVSLDLRLHADPLMVDVDTTRVEQVILNIVVNACQAMGGAGVLSITTEPAWLQDDEDGTARRRAASIVVSDSGPGIPAEHLDKLFEPYFTTKVTGTGLGLASCHGIVRQHGGQIRVSTGKGSGATFRICLPMAAPVVDGAVLTGALDQREPDANATPTVLVVDDERGILSLVRRYFQSSPIRVKEASSGEEAVEVLERTRGGIDLVLTDIQMPGITGIELAEYVEEFYPATKVLFMTGFADESVASSDRVRRAGGLIQKPLSRVDVSRRVQSGLAMEWACRD